MTETHESSDTQTRAGVAVIAVHGVGDPTPGSTGNAVARLLVSQAGYVHKGSDTWLVPVEVVHVGSVVAPSVQGKFGGLGSLAASPFTQSRLHPDKAPQDSQAHDKGDLGIQLNYHLLRGTALNNEEKVYTSHRQQLEKNGKKVDVLDLYWGDLSGLSNAVTQILTELYAMLFHLCQLGRDAAQYTALYMKAKELGSARWLANSQLWADFLFTKPSALLNAIALALCLWWLPLRLISDTIDTNPISPIWFWLVNGVFALCAALLMAICWYNSLRKKWWLAYGLRILVLASGIVFVNFNLNQPVHFAFAFACIWLVLVLTAFDAFLRFSEDSNRGVLVWGRAMAIAMVFAMLWGACRVQVPTEGYAAHRPHLAVWIYSALTALEFVLLSMLCVWILIAAAMASFVAAGVWLRYKQNNPVIRQGIVTGRIGFFVSALLFLALTSFAWVLAQSTISESFQWFEYQSWVSQILSTEKNQTSTQPAYEYINARFKDSTLMFAVIAGLLGFLIVGAVVVLFPSIVAEVKHPTVANAGQALGRWLGRSGVTYTQLVNMIVVLSGVFFVFAMLMLAGHSACGKSADGSFCAAYSRMFGGVIINFGDTAEGVFKILLVITGGTAIGLVALGTRIFGAAGNIRLALDAALDVDRHFREFPDKSTTRGRIAARLKSILLAAQKANYERIVICAHSQGTVIVAELLRYLRERDPDFMASLPDIHLFTCGSPLRQLYSARFPALYEWLEKPLPEDSNTTGPHASMLGVKRWTNAYSTGDYVGRWLWIPPGFNLRKSSIKNEWENGVHRQICLGKGAHTHYYDTHRATVATEIDQLIH